MNHKLDKNRGVPRCFACSQLIEDVTEVIKWHGEVEGFIRDFFLHSECANWMADAIKRDVFENYFGREMADFWYRKMRRSAPHSALQNVINSL